MLFNLGFTNLLSVPIVKSLLNAAEIVFSVFEISG